MAKRPPERYNPGELDKTRNNLGWITREEADRLTKLLGGDVGVERAPESVDDKYRKLQDLNRRKSDRFITGDTIADGSHDHRGGSAPSRTDPAERTRPRFIDRVRIDFHAARPEHMIKTLPNAIRSIFTRHATTYDFVHYKFLSCGDVVFFRHIENLVIAVRGLVALNRRNPTNRLKTPVYRQILDIIKSWDIEGIHAELSRLQVAPRHVTFRYCGTLGRKIFRPIYILIDIDAVHYLRGALKRIYDLNILSLPKKHADVERVKEYYHTAVYETEQVFGQLRFRLYPLLMKLCSVKYYDSDAFYFEERQEILAFLSLSEDDLLKLPSTPHTEPEAAVELEEADVVTEPVLESARNQKGLEVLERLFPKAGWDQLDQFPDLYPYLQPILAFPRGFELVPPDDPLHQTVVLSSILQELFYGFRHIQFGVLYQSVGLKLGETVQQILEGWRVVRDEFITRVYLPKLYDFCREVEHNPQFAVTEFGQKRQRDMLWQVKEYLLPHLVVHRGTAPDVSHTIPRLHALSSELHDLLSAISVELAGSSKDDIRSVRNPWEGFLFDIETPLTRRLKTVMRRYHEEPNNANLLLYTFSVLTLFDSLINDESSYFYPFPVEPLYRTELPDGPIPHYEVRTIDTEALFKEAARDAPLSEPVPTSKKVRTIDELTGALNERGLRTTAEREIARLRSNAIPLSMVSLRLIDFDSYCETKGEEAGVALLSQVMTIISGEVREYRDIPGRLESALFAVLLTETTQIEAIYLALRLLATCIKQKLPVRAAVGIFEVHRTWSTDRVLRMARRSAEAAIELPAPSIALYNEKSNQFLHYKKTT